MNTFVDMCSGSGAVTLKLLCDGHHPVVPYSGGKRGYAGEILTLLGVSREQVQRVLMIDQSVYAEFYAVISSGGGEELASRLDVLNDRPSLDLWRETAARPVPLDLFERVLCWIVLMRWSYPGKPVIDVDGSWRTNGVDRSKMRNLKGTSAAGNSWTRPASTLKELAERIRKIPSMADVCALRQDVRYVAPISGATVYIDPDYVGTTGYGYSVPRLDLMSLVEKWRSAGAVVGVSEAEPLAGGTSSHRLQRARAKGRTFSRQQEEWLTIYGDPRRAPR